MNFESFDFGIDQNPFADIKKKSTVDERFFKLTTDENGDGAAIIRFLPDPEKKLIQQLFKINVNNTNNKGEKRWFNTWSPQNIGRADPFHKRWEKLWRSGQKDEARKFSRQTRYITNILVVNDPAKPENNGKVFLLDMSKSLATRLSEFLMPSKAKQALGRKPVALFNPIEGQNFELVSTMGSNGFINYDDSNPVSEVTSAFASKEEAVDTILNKCYKLSEFLDPAIYLSDEELNKELKRVCFEDEEDEVPTSPQTPASPVTQVTQVAQTAEVHDIVTTPPQTPVTPAAQVTNTQTSTNAAQSNLDQFLEDLM